MVINMFFYLSDFIRWDLLKFERETLTTLKDGGGDGGRGGGVSCWG